MYTRVESRFWQDEKMRAVSVDARYLMLYLLTSPHRNIIGFYFLPAPYACFDLGWDEKRFNVALNELIAAGVVLYDQEAHVLLVVNYLKHNPLENPNQGKGAVSKLKELPQTVLLKDFLTVVEQLSKPYLETKKNPYEALLKRIHKLVGNPFRNPSVTLSKQGTGTGSGTGTGTGSGTEDKNICAPGGAQECVQPQPGGSVEAEKVTATPDKDKPLKKSGPRSPFKSKRQEQLFDEFWEQYQGSQSKGRAERAWQKLKPDNELFAAIMTGLSQAKKPGMEKQGHPVYPPSLDLAE
ncbi:MAG: hypothetical protein RQM92_09770 [Candidatus Syntrophopropionicum ammoniitolerans]